MPGIEQERMFANISDEGNAPACCQQYDKCYSDKCRGIGKPFFPEQGLKQVDFASQEIPAIQFAYQHRCRQHRQCGYGPWDGFYLFYPGLVNPSSHQVTAVEKRCGNHSDIKVPIEAGHAISPEHDARQSQHQGDDGANNTVGAITHDGVVQEMQYNQAAQEPERRVPLLQQVEPQVLHHLACR